MQTRNRALAAVTAAGVALAMSGCASSDQGVGQETGPVTVTMATFLDPAGSTGRETVLKKIIDAFEAENPDITIEVQTTQWDLLTTNFLAGDAAGDAADLNWVPLVEASEAVMSGAYADITDAFTADDVADFDDAFWRGMQVEGKQWGVALSRQTFGLLYRPDIFKAEGIDPAKLDTWEGFTEVARQLSKPEEGFWGFCQAFSAAAAGELTTFGARLLTLQRGFYNEDGTANWASDAGVEALEYTIGLVEDGITPPESATWTSEDPYEQFAAGNCAMATSGNTRVQNMQTTMGEDKATFRLYPAEKDGEPLNLIGTWTVGVWADSPRLEAAKKFISFMVSAESDELWVTEAGQAPTRRSTVDKVALPPHLEAAAEAAAFGYIAPANMVADFRSPFNAIVSDVLVNGNKPIDSLEKAETKANG